MKAKLVECLKLKLAEERDSNWKLVMNNLLEEIVGKKQMLANQSYDWCVWSNCYSIFYVCNITNVYFSYSPSNTL
jgi:hypothetical protein